MANTNVLIYLDVEVSQDGRNMKTIIRGEKKQSGKKNIITNLLKPLGKHTFECGFSFKTLYVKDTIQLT